MVVGLGEPVTLSRAGHFRRVIITTETRFLHAREAIFYELSSRLGVPCEWPSPSPTVHHRSVGTLPQQLKKKKKGSGNALLLPKSMGRRVSLSHSFDYKSRLVSTFLSTKTATFLFRSRCWTRARAAISSSQKLSN